MIGRKLRESQASPGNYHIWCMAHDNQMLAHLQFGNLPSRVVQQCEWHAALLRWLKQSSLEVLVVNRASQVRKKEEYVCQPNLEWNILLEAPEQEVQWPWRSVYITRCLRVFSDTGALVRARGSDFRIITWNLAKFTTIRNMGFAQLVYLGKCK